MRNRVRELRAARGWTQEDFGRRLGVSRQAVIAIEADRHDPSLDLAYRMAALFGLAVEEVFPNTYAAGERP